ncbi:hypothetical protein ADK55_19190 [Streptomyces sp. WM4235]|nr:hypothetical protein ADK55_19190 [Streptomyces sp. WM4235]
MFRRTTDEREHAAYTGGLFGVGVGLGVGSGGPGSGGIFGGPGALCLPISTFARVSPRIPSGGNSTVRAG